MFLCKLSTFLICVKAAVVRIPAQAENRVNDSLHSMEEQLTGKRFVSHRSILIFLDIELPLFCSKILKTNLLDNCIFLCSLYLGSLSGSRKHETTQNLSREQRNLARIKHKDTGIR